MARPNSVDWSPIRTEYITTKCSYRQLSEKYGVSIAQISRVCKKEQWAKQRERYAEKCFRKAEEKAANKEANRLARLIDATTKAIDVAMEAFEDEKQFNRYMVEKKEKYAVPLEQEDGTMIDERQWVEEKTFAKVDTKALKDLTGVLKDLTTLMRDFYNIPTPAQAEAQRIAAERLELDKHRADAGDPKDVSLEIVGIPEEYKR